METMMSLMHEDMVWQNAGDSNIPWIGPWNGKKNHFGRLHAQIWSRIQNNKMGTK